MISLFEGRKRDLKWGVKGEHNALLSENRHAGFLTRSGRQPLTPFAHLHRPVRRPTTASGASLDTKGLFTSCRENFTLITSTTAPVDAMAELDALPESIRDFVQISDGHALWVGPRVWLNGGADVYGRLQWNGRQVYAHRLIHDLLRGPQPGNLRRVCEQPLCVLHWSRPRSLWPDPSRRPRPNDSDARFIRKLRKLLDKRLTRLAAAR